MNRVRLKAFTILEMMVVMLLTTIVMAIAYSGSSIFYKEYLLYRGRAERTASLSLLDRLLTQDFSRSERVIRYDSGLQCLYASKNVTYHFEENLIVRKDSMLTDTFKFNLSPPVIGFNGRPVVENTLADELSFQLMNKEEVIYFQFYKQYASDVLINYYNDRFSLQPSREF